MTNHEMNTLLRPYLLRQQAKKEKNMYAFIMGALLFCIFAAAFALTLAFALNH
jgi:hypothetical protein